MVKYKLPIAFAAAMMAFAPIAGQAATIERSSQTVTDENSARSSVLWIAILVAVVVAVVLLAGGGNNNKNSVSK